MLWKYYNFFFNWPKTFIKLLKKYMYKSETSYQQLIINRSHLKDYLIERAMHLHKSNPNKIGFEPDDMYVLRKIWI